MNPSASRCNTSVVFTCGNRNDTTSIPQRRQAIRAVFSSFCFDNEYQSATSEGIFSSSG